MSLSHKLRELLTGKAYSCEVCNFSPDANEENFKMVNAESDLLAKYCCPNCTHEFVAALCGNCGRGYGGTDDFSPQDVDRSGTEDKYHCKCGNTLSQKAS